MSAVFDSVVAARLAPAHAAPSTVASRHDLRFARDVLAGLAQAKKAIPCCWFYDDHGSELFVEITRSPEYYAARTETAILERCVAQIANAAGPGATVVELGSGSAEKTPILLAALEAPAAYVPIDLSTRFLAESAQALRARFPELHVESVVADFSRIESLPALPISARGRRLVFFPGTTIGNFTPHEACALLRRIRRWAGADALLVVGAVASRNPALLIPAYDDAQGMTAAFNKNLLARINRELGGDFDLGAFRHEARFDARRQCVEMHLVSQYPQRVGVLGRSIRFDAGESIHTESSYKYSLPRFESLARDAGWMHCQYWSDAQARYGVHVLERVG